MNIFVTGTDTGAGKTLVSSILALKFGFNYWKPIQSGLTEKTDSEWMASILGTEPIQREVYRLQKPVAPYLASISENVEIDLNEIVENAPRGSTIIEGCGGLLAPLNANEFIIDLILMLGTPVVIVARTTLGTLNHSLLTIKLLRNTQVPILGVIMVGNSEPDTFACIEKFGKVQIVGHIPFLKKKNIEVLRDLGKSIQLEVK
jgi:dethiobiotin synthetase